MAKGINKKVERKRAKKLNPFQGFLKPPTMRVRYLLIKTNIFRMLLKNNYLTSV